MAYGDEGLAKFYHWNGSFFATPSSSTHEIPTWFLHLDAPILLPCLLDYSTYQLQKVPNIWSTKATITKRLQANINYSSYILHSWETSRFYPALQLPNSGQSSDNQFALQPSSTTTAAAVALLHTVRTRYDAVVQSVHPCLLVRLHQSIQHGVIWYADDKNGTDAHSWQLDWGLLRKHYHCMRYAGSC